MNDYSLECSSGTSQPSKYPPLTLCHHHLLVDCWHNSKVIRRNLFVPPGLFLSVCVMYGGSEGQKTMTFQKTTRVPESKGEGGVLVCLWTQPRQFSHFISLDVIQCWMRLVRGMLWTLRCSDCENLLFTQWHLYLKSIGELNFGN